LDVRKEEAMEGRLAGGLGSGAAAMVDCWLRRSNNSCCLDGSWVVLVQLVAGSVGGLLVPDGRSRMLGSDGGEGERRRVVCWSRWVVVVEGGV